MKKSIYMILIAVLVLEGCVFAGIYGRKTWGQRYHRLCEAVTYSMYPDDSNLMTHVYADELALDEAELNNLSSKDLFLAFVDYPSLYGLTLAEGRYQTEQKNYNFAFGLMWCDALRVLLEREDGLDTLLDGYFQLTAKLKSKNEAYFYDSSINELYAIDAIELYLSNGEVFYGLDQDLQRELLAASFLFRDGATKIHPERSMPSESP